MPSIDQFLKAMRKAGGSDLHIQEGEAPKMRLHGHIMVIPGFEQTVMTTPFMEGCLGEIAPVRHWEIFSRTGDADFAYAMAPDAPGGASTTNTR